MFQDHSLKCCLPVTLHSTNRLSTVSGRNRLCASCDTRLSVCAALLEFGLNIVTLRVEKFWHMPISLPAVTQGLWSTFGEQDTGNNTADIAAVSLGQPEGRALTLGLTTKSPPPAVSCTEGEVAGCFFCAEKCDLRGQSSGSPAATERSELPGPPQQVGNTSHAQRWKHVAGPSESSMDDACKSGCRVG